MGLAQSDQEFHCPECGALLAVGADHCWKCRREFPTATESPPTSSDLPPFRHETHGNPLPPEEKGIRLLKTLGALVAIVVAAGIAFFATCFGGFFISSEIGPGGEAGLGQAIGIGLISGGLGALVVIVALIWLFWLRPRR